MCLRMWRLSLTVWEIWQHGAETLISPWYTLWRCSKVTLNATLFHPFEFYCCMYGQCVHFFLFKFYVKLFLFFSVMCKEICFSVICKKNHVFSVMCQVVSCFSFICQVFSCFSVMCQVFSVLVLCVKKIRVFSVMCQFFSVLVLCIKFFRF